MLWFMTAVLFFVLGFISAVAIACRLDEAERDRMFAQLIAAQEAGKEPYHLKLVVSK